MSLNAIAFIPDGNRRYARKVGINYAQAYTLGTEKAWDVINWLGEYPKIKMGTFYTLSLENLSRNRLELKVLFKIFDHELDKVFSRGLFEAQGVKLKFMGRLDLLPLGTRKRMEKVEDYTSEFDKKQINLAIGYNGQAEIVDAAKKFAEDCSRGAFNSAELNEEKFAKYLYNSSSPDLVIRTGDTQRLSGFLTYQSAYSELCFSEKFWPEFEKQDLKEAVKDFDSRERRFGK